MKPYYQDNHCTIYHGDCWDVLPALDLVDHIITDPPYSERTHSGHETAVIGTTPGNRKATKGRGDGSKRRALNYGSITPEQCAELGHLFVKQSAGWIVWMSDHNLIPAIHDALSERYVFAPLPFFQPGSRVRLAGDGPSSWTIWITVARTKKLMRWGTLPGGYVSGPGWKDSEYVGGKPLRLMTALVGDYSRPGETILDPFMGYGTTLRAAKDLGRKSIGIEIDERCCEISAKRLAQEVFDFGQEKGAA